MGLEARDLVTARIETVEDALNYVVGDARNQVVSLDWQRFDVDLERAGDLFDISWGVVLANSGLNLSLNVLNTQRLEEAALLEGLPPHQKRGLGDNIHWLVLREVMEPQEATRVRDYLWAKGIDMVAGASNLDIEQVSLSFSIGHHDRLIPLFRRLSSWLPTG